MLNRKAARGKENKSLETTRAQTHSEKGTPSAQAVTSLWLDRDSMFAALSFALSFA